MGKGISVQGVSARHAASRSYSWSIAADSSASQQHWACTWNPSPSRIISFCLFIGSLAIISVSFCSWRQWGLPRKAKWDLKLSARLVVLLAPSISEKRSSSRLVTAVASDSGRLSQQCQCPDHTIDWHWNQTLQIFVCRNYLSAGRGRY